jgi:hypothetical protein
MQQGAGVSQGSTHLSAPIPAPIDPLSDSGPPGMDPPYEPTL